MSSTWTVIWMFVTPLPAVFLAAHLALLLDRTKQREEDAKRLVEQREGAARRSARLTQVLTEGLQRNVVVLRRMRSIAQGEGPNPPASPSQRLERGHFDATIVSAVDLLEADPQKYGALLNASDMAAHINRRAQVLEDIEWMPLQPHPIVGSERDIRKQRRCWELVGLIGQALPVFEAVITYLGGAIPAESES